MSNQDGFTGGFFTGALVGGLIGGILGTVLASRRTKAVALPRQGDVPSDLKSSQDEQLQGEERIEVARQILEVKIAQLNDAIDEVRHQLHGVNGGVSHSQSDRVLPEDH